MTQASSDSPSTKRDAHYVFYELTRSICPTCRRVIDAQVLLRDNKVFLRKRCPEHGQFAALVYSDAQVFTSAAKFNKPGMIPLAYATEVVNDRFHAGPRRWYGTRGAFQSRTRPKVT
jgi:7,8-dihydro-6-hydroxymethylpterin dimethyltransferase